MSIIDRIENRYYDIRNDFLNNLICWLSKHCRCYASTFYCLCSKYYYEEVEIMARLWVEHKKEEK